MKKRVNTSGFTIVELLVVIVVIGILASITIVSYNGITARANNVKMLSSADAWSKTILLYKASTGQYPKIPTSTVYDNWCVGSSFPETSDFPEGTCIIINDPANGINNYTGGFIHNPDFDTELKKVTTIPNIEYDPIIITSGTMTVKIRGMRYTGSTTNGILTYYMPGDADCARGTKTLESITTRCDITVE